MKSSHFFNKYFFVLSVCFAIIQLSYGQKGGRDEQKKADIKEVVQSKNYVFVAQSVLPLTGRLINLTSAYDLQVKGDTVVSDLPYFGRAYVAPLDPAEGGIHFTSTDFNYTVRDRNKGGWDISILPKDTKDVRQMLLTVAESGYASLQVVSNNKQSIGYNGYITRQGEM